MCVTDATPKDESLQQWGLFLFRWCQLKTQADALLELLDTSPGCHSIERGEQGRCR
jgi:hypothetical protein